MKKSNRTKAVLFDLDGVLVDMPNGHFEALNRALSVFGAKIEEDEHRVFFNGLPTAKKLEELERQHRLPLGLRDFICDLKQIYTKRIIPDHCLPDYSKIVMLRHLRDKGLKLGCCSNSICETLHLMLRAAQLFDFFDIIIGNNQVQNPKPHPEIYLTAMEALGVHSHETIIVEDSPHGITAAKSSGAMVYEVRNIHDVHLNLFSEILAAAD